MDYEIVLTYVVKVENSDSEEEAIQGAIYNLYYNLSKDEVYDPKIFDSVKVRSLKEEVRK